MTPPPRPGTTRARPRPTLERAAGPGKRPRRRSVSSTRCGPSASVSSPLRATLQETVRDAQLAEDAGFDIFQVGDHVGAAPPPLLSLAAAAGTTERIRLGTLVLNNDLRHPLPLAQELATLDQLRSGRLEVGLGAGHSFTEYEAMGQAFDPPAVRKERLGESVEIVRGLLDGGPVSFSGTHYRLREADDTGARAGARAPARRRERPDGARPCRPPRRHRRSHHARPDEGGRAAPRRALGGHAARRHHRVDAPRGRGPLGGIELHALVQAVVVTDDRDGCSPRSPGASASDAADALSHARSSASEPTPRSPDTCWPVGSAGGSATTACATSAAFARSSNGSRGGPQRVRRRCRIRRRSGQDTVLVRNRCRPGEPGSGPEQVRLRLRLRGRALQGALGQAGARRRRGSRRRRRRCPGSSGPR